MAVLGGGWRFLMSEVPVTARVEVLKIKRLQVLHPSRALTCTEQVTSPHGICAERPSQGGAIPSEEGTN